MTTVAHVPAQSTESVVEALRRDGIVAVRDVWPAAAIDAVAEVVLTQHPEFTDVDRLENYLGDKGTRFEAPVALTDAVRACQLHASRALEAIYTALLGDDFVYDAFGILMVRPGAPPQHRHRDGGVLFPGTGLDRVLPPSALTVAFPLVDVDSDFAPTGAAPGSHRADNDDADDELVPIPLARGSAAIWDYRTLHGGLANRTDRARPALYFTVCRPFWIDHKNLLRTERPKLIGDPRVLEELGPRFARGKPM